MKSKSNISIGDKFNEWVVLSLKRKIINKNHLILCRCKCGFEKYTRLGDLRNGSSKRCKACSLDMNRRIKHGMSSHPIYVVWNDMIKRCYNENVKYFKNYGGRGIEVSSIWVDDPEAFIKWCINNGYKKGLQIDRIDNDGNYTPDNCRFVTRKVNNRNRSTNIFLTCFGETKTIVEWSEDERCNVPYCTLYERVRLYNWDNERAITEYSMRVKK